MKVCHGCGQLKGVEEYDKALWDLYHRWDNSRKFIEPLVYTQNDIYEAGGFEEDGSDGIMLSMERNMAERGLCPECGRPDLQGVPESDFLTQEEADDQAAYYAEVAWERRMGM